jgi:hypothetical protein
MSIFARLEGLADSVPELSEDVSELLEDVSCTQAECFGVLEHLATSFAESGLTLVALGGVALGGVALGGIASCFMASSTTSFWAGLIRCNKTQHIHQLVAGCHHADT